MNVTINLIFGKLKLKSYPWLRTHEREGKVPVFKIGSVYLVWRSHKHDRS